MASSDGCLETWPELVRSADALPRDCQPLFAKLFGSFPYCVRIPPNRYSYKVEAETFLCLDELRIVTIRRAKSGLRAAQFLIAKIDAVETCTTLLLSRISFPMDGGKKETVFYNTVGEELFEPFRDSCIDLWSRGRSHPSFSERLDPDPFEDLISLDYKYHSYALSALRGDEARARFYHPSIAVPGFFDKSRIITSYLLVSSPTILYCLSEEPPIRSRKYAEYSAMKRYIPISPILSVHVPRGSGKERCVMYTINAGSAVFKLPLARELEPALMAFFEGIGRDAG